MYSSHPLPEDHTGPSLNYHPLGGWERKKGVQAEGFAVTLLELYQQGFQNENEQRIMTAKIEFLYIPR